MNGQNHAAAADQRRKLSEYLGTVLFYCGDILSDSFEIGSMASENRRLERIIQGLRDIELYDAGHACILENAMNGLHKKISAIYFRNPEDGFIERLFVRSGNIRDMCTQCSAGFSALGSRSMEDRGDHERG